MRITLAITPLVIIATLLMGTPVAGAGQPDSAGPMGQAGLEINFLGVVNIPTGYMFQETQVGGLSGITYDAAADRYLAVSDDRSRFQPARFYTLAIDLSDGRLDPGDVQFIGVAFLKDAQGKTFERGAVDPEAIAVTAGQEIYIASEGDARKGLLPFVNGFKTGGTQVRQLPVPSKFLPGVGSGIRNNLAFESLALTPDQRHLFTAVENALLQDGPQADLGQPSPARIIQYDLTRNQVAAEYLYPVSPVVRDPLPGDGARDNGLVELLALDDRGTLLALERSYSEGVGVTARLFRVSTAGAADISGVPSLVDRPEAAVRPVSKTEIADFNQWLPWVDNLEGMTFGPRLPDGRRSLIVVSDNNFSERQTTQIIALSVKL